MRKRRISIALWTGLLYMAGLSAQVGTPGDETAIRRRVSASATSMTLEVKVQFLDANLAAVDRYWYAADRPGVDRWGRTTYTFKKVDGQWTGVVEREADLSSPYRRRFEALPAAVPVAADTLASYAGVYESARGKRLAEVKVSGDRLDVTTRNGRLTGIPASETEFLAFAAHDLEQYFRIRFTKQPDGSVELALLQASGEKILDARKVEEQ